MSSPRQLGTPKNLDELTHSIMLCPMFDFRNRVPAEIKDYLANKMAPSIMLAKDDPKLEKILMDLFYHMTERKKP